MIYPDSRVIVLARAPRAGQAKTRLIPRLGAHGAAAFQARLIERCLQTVTGAGLSPVELWCTPSRDEPFFRDCRERYDVGLYDQIPGGLGARMHAALTSALNHAASVLLIGTDVPTLQAGDLDEAFHALHAGADIVLGPARDGGYYLIGMKQADRRVFEGIRWGGATVYQDTVFCLREHGWRWYELREQRDVDTPEDYERIPEAIKRSLTSESARVQVNTVGEV